MHDRCGDSLFVQREAGGLGMDLSWALPMSCELAAILRSISLVLEEAQRPVPPAVEETVTLVDDPRREIVQELRARRRPRVAPA